MAPAPACGAGSGPPSPPARRGTMGGGSGKVKFKTAQRNTVYDALRNRGWAETEGDADWDVLWTDTHWVAEHFGQTGSFHLRDSQRVNHFPKHYELTRKDLLVKNLKRARKAAEKEQGAERAHGAYAFFPTTFTLPIDYRLFVEEFKRSGGVWIMKPIGRAQGKGIFLFTKLSQISDWKKANRWNAGPEGERVDNYIVQRYVDAPYLIGGKKFDLRLYVLVTSYSPLRFYIYRGGFARFSATRFTMDRENISNNFMHLTNVAVQKTAENYDAKSGMKWAIQGLKLYLVSKHGAAAVGALFDGIQDMISKSLLAVQPRVIHDKHCFELYGYDVMIDAALKPWLIEVNASPSLTADTQEDYDLKFGMLDDTFTLLDVERRRDPHDIPLQCGGFDLIWNHGPVPSFLPGAASRIGGCNAAHEYESLSSRAITL